jgi:hypothetical protein
MAANEALPRADVFDIVASGAIADNAGVGPISGEPLLWGLASSPGQGVPVVCETSYTPPGSLVPTGNISVKRVGAFFLTVSAKSSINPGTGKAINPGDRIYADGGTLDTVDGILYGFTLNANSSTGWNFGHAMDAIPSGQTATIRVMLGS